MFNRRNKKTPGGDRQNAQAAPPENSKLKHSLLSLEQRLMFDAAAAATAAEVASEQVAQEQAEAAVSSEAAGDGRTTEQHESQEFLQAIATYNPGESTTEIAFVDPTVPDYKEMIAGMGPNVEVVMLDAARDGMEQIAESLAGRSDIDAIHLISHGSSGELQLGTGTLTGESMSTEYADELATIRGALSDHADLLVYGCNFADGQAGVDAVQQLADLTGADVQASNDETGHISLGGDWEFEVQTGTIETSLAVDYDTQMNWAGILGAETVVDQFSERLFENSDGTQSWSSDWSESDAGGHDAKGGDIRVNSGQLRIDTNAVGNAISREVDLSRATNATLTFEYTNRLSGGECIELRVSSDGGTTYRTLDGGVFSNESNTDSGAVKFDLSDSCSANTRIQFTVTGAGKGGGDRLHVDNVQISYDTVPLNEAPTDLSLSANTVAENAVTGTVIGTVSGTDVDTGDAKTYSLTDTADGRFAINSATGQLTVANGSLLNYESAASHTVTVRVTDSGGQSYDEAFTINLTNVNEAPTITSNGGGAPAAVNVAENQNTVTMVAAMDVDTGTTLTYGIAGGPDAMRFSIDSATGALRFSTAPNFERPSDVGRNNVYDVTVQVSDGQGGTATQSISVRVTDVNEAPRITSNRGGDVASVTIRENSSAVTKVRATDPDRGARITYSVVEGADSALFTINPSTGVLRFSSAPNFEQPTDTDRNNVYQVVVQASDGRGGTDSQMISVRVANVNEAPSGADATITLTEDTTHILTATTFGFNDVDARDSLSAVRIDTLPTAGTLTLSGVAVTAGQVVTVADLAAGNLVFMPVADANGTGYANFTFSVRDSNRTYDAAPNTLTVNVTAVNDAPTDVSLTSNTVTENAANGTVVGTVSGIDLDSGDPKTYSLTDTAGGRFAIDSSTGQITVANGSLLNFEAATSHSVTVQVMDSGGLTYAKTFAINLTNVNEGPTFAGSLESHVLIADLGAGKRVTPSVEIANKTSEPAFHPPDDRRESIEVRPEPTRIVEAITPAKNLPHLAHEKVIRRTPVFEGKNNLPIFSGEREGAAVNLDETGNQAVARLGSSNLPAPHTEEMEGRSDESDGLDMSMAAGLAGVVLPGSVGAKEKLVAITRRLHAHGEPSSSDMEPQPSRNGDDSSPPNESERGGSASHKPGPS